MASIKLSKSSIAWKYYLIFLWLVAVIFLALIIYGVISVEMQADQNPASGLAITGVFAMVVILIIFCGFIFLNTYIRKRIGHNEKASWWFLSASWAIILATVLIFAVTIVQGWAAQEYYEKNVLPQQQACYDDYLNGSRATPHCSE